MGHQQSVEYKIDKKFNNIKEHENNIIKKEIKPDNNIICQKSNSLNNSNNYEKSINSNNNAKNSIYNSSNNYDNSYNYTKSNNSNNYHEYSDYSVNFNDYISQNKPINNIIPSNYQNKPINNIIPSNYQNNIKFNNNYNKNNYDNIKSSNYINTSNYINYFNTNNFINSITSNDNISLNNNKKKKLELNILYYDESLRKNEENSDNCTFFQMNTKGTFYGCHTLELFKLVCEKIKNSNKKFILITSGSSAEKIYESCRCMEEIREYYIYCFLKNKYIHLLNIYPKLKGVYDDVNDLINKLYSIEEIKNDTIKSSNLIYFEDYNKTYIKLHNEIIRSYLLYKTLKEKNMNENDFLTFIKNEDPNFLDLAQQLFPDKKEIIDFFKKNTNEPESTILDIFNSNDDIQSYIHNYTKESFYCYYLNKFLREGDFDSFRILASHISKFIYFLYDYRNNNRISNQYSLLYRKMYINPNEIEQYFSSVGRVICYPSFTSTSLDKDIYEPEKRNPNDELVLIKINQNNSKSVVEISKLSDYEDEKEYLFLPFSFFKIKYVKKRHGTLNNPHLISLLALTSDKPIEEMFLDFSKKETDNLDPEGLDMLLLKNNKEKIIFNPIYLNHN